MVESLIEPRAEGLIELYRQNPIVALEELLHIELAVPQRLIFKDMWENNFVIVSAGRGTGKCVSGDTLIPTCYGFKRIGDLGSEAVPLSDISIGVRGFEDKRLAYKWFYDGVRKVNRIETSFGYHLEGTDEHRIKVMDSFGGIVWKACADVKEGDFVLINRSKGVWSSTDSCTEDEALLLGLLIGDGCFRGARRISVLEKLDSLGVENGVRPGAKRVPLSVLESSKKVVGAFLRGLFETGGGCEKECVSYCSKSMELAETVHLLLLNFGIVSKLKTKQVLYKGTYRPYYVVTIASNNIDVFSQEIGFLSDRKKESLCELIGLSRNPNKDVIPGQAVRFLRMWNKCRGVIPSASRALFRKYGNGYYKPSVASVEKCLGAYPFDDADSRYLHYLLDNGFFFDEVVSKDCRYTKVYDLVVDGDHSFTANGFINHNSFLLAAFACLRAMLYPGTRVGFLAPSFRQAKGPFEEARKMWLASSVFREATVGRPTFQSDRCLINFKSSGTTPPSLIEADPLGTGDKIRGLRLHVLLIDEFAQMPEVLFDTVIKPMAATSRSPMERVRIVQQMKRLKGAGASEEALESYGTANKIIMVSSAYYKFNHMYRRIQQYEDFISRGKKDYAVRSISYVDMPEGFLSEDIINEAKATMPASLFRMEYEAIWESDSDGVFKASLLSQRILPPGDTIRKAAQNGLVQHIVSCDPARTSDFFSIVVFELGDPIKVVNVLKYHRATYPRMAEIVMGLCEKYNVARLVIDSQGGGHAIKDLLADSAKFGKNIIIDIDDESFIGVEGRRILQMVNPSPSYNSEANYASLNLLEQGKLWFPGTPISGDEQEEKEYELVKELIQQLLNIVVTQTRSGIVHFDVPVGGGHGAQKKDLYSAFIYGAHKAYQLSIEREKVGGILWDIGIVRTVTKTAGSPVFGGVRTSPSAVIVPNR